MNRKGSLVWLFLIGLCTCFSATVSESEARAGDEPSSVALRRADAFLKTPTTGKYVLGFVHMGTTYVAHEYVDTMRVKQNGKVAPGHFALVYKYRWDDDGITTLAFLCDDDGDIYEVQVLKHNAIINTPFDIAKLSINLLGELLLKAFGENMNTEDRKQMENYVRNPDPKGILEMGLKFRQKLNLK